MILQVDKNDMSQQPCVAKFDPDNSLRLVSVNWGLRI